MEERKKNIYIHTHTHTHPHTMQAKGTHMHHPNGKTRKPRNLGIISTRIGVDGAQLLGCLGPVHTSTPSWCCVKM